MKQARILIESATPKQLRDFAEIVLGLEIKGNENAAIMKGRLVEAGYAVDTITDIAKDNENASQNALQPSMVNESRRIGENGSPETRIIIPESERDAGDMPVPVGVNGVTILIPRGLPSWVPDEYVEALRNAVEFVYDEFKGQKAANGIDLGGLSKPREVQSYPFSIV